MEKKYRIASRGHENWPQTRVNRRWKKIAAHPGGEFGLYPEGDRSHPKSIAECKRIIEDYDLWNSRKQLPITYKEI